MLKLLGVGLFALVMFLVFLSNFDGTGTSVPTKSIPVQVAQVEPTPAQPFYAKPGQPQRMPGQPDPVIAASIQAAQEKARLYANKQGELAVAKKRAELKKATQEQVRLQPKRKRFIQKLISQGVFSKVEMPGNLPHLWVRPVFYSLDYETKKQFVNVVWAYYKTENPRWHIVILKDSRTGKRIGSYSRFGLDLD